LTYSYLIFQVITGKKVADKNDKKSKDWPINEGKLLTGNKIPIKIDLEKSGLGNNSKPTNNPIKIDKYAFFQCIPFQKCQKVGIERLFVYP
jgi:hypothetical protein